MSVLLHAGLLLAMLGLAAGRPARSGGRDVVPLLLSGGGVEPRVFLGELLSDVGRLLSLGWL